MAKFTARGKAEISALETHDVNTWPFWMLTIIIWKNVSQRRPKFLKAMPLSMASILTGSTLCLHKAVFLLGYNILFAQLLCHEKQPFSISVVRNCG